MSQVPPGRGRENLKYRELCFHHETSRPRSHGSKVLHWWEQYSLESKGPQTSSGCTDSSYNLGHITSICVFPISKRASLKTTLSSSHTVGTRAPWHRGSSEYKLFRILWWPSRMGPRIPAQLGGLATYPLLSRKLHSFCRCLQVCSGWTMLTSGIYVIQYTFQGFPYPFSDLINGQWDTNHLIWQIRELRPKELDAHLTKLLQLQGSLRDQGFQPPGFTDEEIEAQGPQEPTALNAECLCPNLWAIKFTSNRVLPAGI